MDDFKEKLALNLAANPEFIKEAMKCYDRKMTWYCVSQQINKTIAEIDIPKNSEE